MCSTTRTTARTVRPIGAAAFHDLSQLTKRRRLADASTTSTTSTKQQQRQQSFQPLHAPFRVFRQQAEAFEFLDAQPCAAILRTFALETSSAGSRVFLITSAELFWAHYSALPAAARHHYEILRQGCPVHAYFDLEFCPASNPVLDGARLVQLLLTGVRDQLAALFDIPWHPSFALELDSSTPSKFSRHIIVRLPGLAFADVCQAGRFARRVVLSLLLRGRHCSRAAGLLVASKDEGQLTCFVDMGVYTRNRAFRLMLSSKCGKTAQLRLTHRFGGRSRCPKAAFHDCLISVLHQHRAPSSSRVGSAAAAGHGSRQQLQQQQQHVSLLWVPDDGDELLQQLPAAWRQVAMLQLRPLEHVQQGLASATAAPVLGGAPQPAPGGGQHQWRGGQWSQPCCGPSPFPLLDRFIGSVCSQGGVAGKVRSWLLQPGGTCGGGQADNSGGSSSTVLLFNIRHNRWCGNIGRAHKSNGVYYAGVYYQKCYDPECRSYRSSSMPLPADVWRACTQQLAAQQQQLAAAVAAAAGEGDDDDEQCLQLLSHFEAEHALAAAAAARAQVDAGGAASEDEDEACVQLLLDVERQLAAAGRVSVSAA